MSDVATIKAHYLRLYKAADDILRQADNPCQIQVGTDGCRTCIMTRLGKKNLAPVNTLCCAGCKHHDPATGCTVQALGCKLGWCYTNNSAIENMYESQHPTFVAIAALKREAIELGVPLGWRTSFEQSFAWLEGRS